VSFVGRRPVNWCRQAATNCLATSCRLLPWCFRGESPRVEIAARYIHSLLATLREGLRSAVVLGWCGALWPALSSVCVTA
jgi:hypothetical protein